jgi:hypothetical protein
MQKLSALWRNEIDSLAFQPVGHEGFCVIHRRAFRSLLNSEPTSQSCLDFFIHSQPLFEQAALEKIQRAGIALTENFHLNSRNIRRLLDIQTQ